MSISEALIGFTIVAALLTIIPGLDTALVLRSSITRSKGYAFATAGGIQTGVMIWGIAAAAGASALLAVSRLGYELLSLAGAAYLVGMGVWLIVGSFRTHHGASDVPPTTGGPARGWLIGVATNLLNPKVGVFYLATIPQFVPPGAAPLLMGMLLAAVHCVLGMAWFTGVIAGGAALGARMRAPRVVRWVDRVTGGVLLAFGAKLALDTRF